jgi:hypothetical protein
MYQQQARQHHKDNHRPETFVLAGVKSNLGRPAASLAYRAVEAENSAVKLEWVDEHGG